jgi:trehalose synthase
MGGGVAEMLRSFLRYARGLGVDARWLVLEAGPEFFSVTKRIHNALHASAAWRALPEALRRVAHLALLPMADLDENAAIVNALQRHAAVVVQKSIVEGFGLTVTEAMWKGRPVVASAVGGIRDQIRDGVDGLLVRSPTDLGEFAAAVHRALTDEVLARRLGESAHARVSERRRSTPAGFRSSAEEYRAPDRLSRRSSPAPPRRSTSSRSPSRRA